MVCLLCQTQGESNAANTEGDEMDDMILRQQAIDGFYEMASDMDHLCTVSDYVSFLESLPSVHPERCEDCANFCKARLLIPQSESSETKQDSSDCIIRNAAIDALCDNCDTVDSVCAHFPCKRYISIENLPSVQPEIIRCKDCKYCDSYIAEITSDGNMERIEYRCKDFHASVMPDEYCSRGERRDG